MPKPLAALFHNVQPQHGDVGHSLREGILGEANDNPDPKDFENFEDHQALSRHASSDACGHTACYLHLNAGAAGADFCLRRTWLQGRALQLMATKICDWLVGFFFPLLL